MDIREKLLEHYYIGKRTAENERDSAWVAVENCQEERNDVEHEIIVYVHGLEARVAELEAEKEQSRWHYPDNGELPKSPERDIVAEISPTGSKNHHTFYECLFVTDELELFDEWRDKMWDEKYIVRWRYVL